MDDAACYSDRHSCERPPLACYLPLQGSCSGCLRQAGGTWEVPSSRPTRNDVHTHNDKEGGFYVGICKVESQV